jgi:hypothetical protein
MKKKYIFFEKFKNCEFLFFIKEIFVLFFKVADKEKKTYTKTQKKKHKVQKIKKGRKKTG